MVQAIAIMAVLAGLYGLWIVGWGDLLRVVQGVRHTRGEVVRHDFGGDGFVAIYQFPTPFGLREVAGRTGYTSPNPPVGTSAMLSYPARRPDLARPPHVFARAIMYAGFAAWLGFFSDLLLGWIS